MAVHFHALTVKNIVKETDDCVSVTFDVPAALAKEFAYKEGQNITIRANVNGAALRRSYSLCTAPHENQLKVAIKKVSNGLFSKFANEVLKPGDILEVLPPTGKFNARTTASANSNFLAIAAGSGITPVISIIKHVLQTQPGAAFTLIYANKNLSSIIFFEELEALKNKYMQRFSLINVLSREQTETDINYGRISKDKLASMQQLVPFTSFDNIYLCGPEQMIFAAKDFFESIGISKQKIHFELFNTPGRLSASEETRIEPGNDFTDGCNITIKLDGRNFSFKLPANGPGILDAALLLGADLPYACKGGVCCSCRAKLLSGKVHMDLNYALEPEELEQGYILTCQSHPLTENVVIDFDTK